MYVILVQILQEYSLKIRMRDFCLKEPLILKILYLLLLFSRPYPIQIHINIILI